MEWSWSLRTTSTDVFMREESMLGRNESFSAANPLRASPPFPGAASSTPAAMRGSDIHLRAVAGVAGGHDRQYPCERSALLYVTSGARVRKTRMCAADLAPRSRHSFRVRRQERLTQGRGEMGDRVLGRRVRHGEARVRVSQEAQALVLLR